KKNNTPHEFVINGKRVESYFSPTDGVNSKIVEIISTSNHDLSIGTMLLTRDEIASAIVAAKTAGSIVNMLTNSEPNNGANVNTTLLAGLGNTHYVFYGSTGIMHNKYMIVDQGAPASDPMAWTGSHNWSAAANNDNDENTLIIHDATIANLYYQNFAKLFVTSNGSLSGIGDVPANETSDNRLHVYPNPIHDGNISITCFTASAGKGTLQLIDVTGKILNQDEIMLIKGENTLNQSFQVSHKGIYLLRLTTANSVWNTKVLFE
ncbi:MAG: phospholipase D-like domain-containing protein, partial [Bacteroidales bacterium]